MVGPYPGHPMSLSEHTTKRKREMNIILVYFSNCSCRPHNNRQIFCILYANDFLYFFVCSSKEAFELKIRKKIDIVISSF